MTKTMKKVVMIVLVAIMAMSAGLFGSVKTSKADTASMNAFIDIVDDFMGVGSQGEDLSITDADLVEEAIQVKLIQAKAYYDKMETAERESLSAAVAEEWEAIQNVAGPALTVYSAMASLSIYLRPVDAPRISVHKQAELDDAKLRHQALDGTNSEIFADMRIAYDYSTAAGYETKFFDDLQALIDDAWDAINEAKAAIDAIWANVEVIGLDREDEIIFAGNKIDAVIPADRGEITNMDLYTEAVAQLEAIKALAQTLADDINALYGQLVTTDGAELYYTKLEEINALKARYDALEETPANAVQTYFQTAHAPEYAKLLEMLAYCDDVADKIQEVIDLINAIGDVKYTPECKAAIDLARAKYEALDADVKNTTYITNYQTLLDAEAKYDDMKSTIDAVILLIDAIPDDITLTTACEDAIKAAEDAYAALSQEYKDNVPADKYGELVDARSEYDGLVAIVEAWIARVKAFYGEGTIAEIWAADLDEIADLKDEYDNEFDVHLRAYVDAKGATAELAQIEIKAEANIVETQTAIDALATTTPDQIVEKLLEAKEMYDTLHSTQQAKINKAVLEEKWAKYQAVSYFDKAVALIKANVDNGLYFTQDATFMNALFVLYNELDAEGRAMVKSYNDLVAVENVLIDAELVNVYDKANNLAAKLEELNNKLGEITSDGTNNNVAQYIDALQKANAKLDEELGKANTTATIALIVAIVAVVAAAVIFFIKK